MDCMAAMACDKAAAAAEAETTGVGVEAEVAEHGVFGGLRLLTVGTEVDEEVVQLAGTMVVTAAAAAAAAAAATLRKGRLSTREGAGLGGR